MEEYIKLEEEKARWHGKVYNWETAMYGKICYNEDVHNLRSVETEFSAIIFNDKLSSKKTLSCEPTVSSLNNNKIDFRISFDESDDEDYMVIFDKNSFSYKIIYANDLKTDSENNNEKVNMSSFPSPMPTVSCFDDLDFFKYFENEFPGIVYNDALTSKSDFLTEPTLSPQHIDEVDLKDETSLSECDEEEQNVLYFNDLFPFNIIYTDDLKSDKDNDINKIDIIQSSGGNEETQGFKRFLKASQDKINKIFIMKSFVMELDVNIMAWNYLNNGMLLNLIKNLYVSFGILFDPKCYYKDGVYTRMLRRPSEELGKSTKEVHMVLVFDFRGLTNLIAEGLRGRMLMEHRDAQGQGVFTSRAWRRLFKIRGSLVHELIMKFLSTFSLHTAEEIETPHPTHTYQGSDAKAMPIADCVQYFFMASIESGTLIIRDLPEIDMTELVRLQICEELDDTWAWVAPRPKRQQAPQPTLPMSDHHDVGTEVMQVDEDSALAPHCKEIDEVVILEYLVKIRKKARILELKRRHLKIIVADIQYALSIKEDTAYLCTSLKTTNDHEQNGRIQRRPIHRIQVMEIKYSEIISNVFPTPIRLDNPNITMEEYIKLEEEKARWHDMALLPRDQRHQYLRFEGLQYTNADIVDFETRLGRMLMEHRDAQGQGVFTSRAWRRLFEIRGSLVHELIMEFLSTFRFGEAVLDLDTTRALQFQLGRVRRRMSWREFILGIGLHTAEEIESVRFGAYWAESVRQIPTRGPRPKRQQVAAAGATEAAEDAPVVDRWLWLFATMIGTSAATPMFILVYVLLYATFHSTGSSDTDQIVSLVGPAGDPLDQQVRSQLIGKDLVSRLLVYQLPLSSLRKKYRLSLKNDMPPRDKYFTFSSRLFSRVSCSACSLYACGVVVVIVVVFVVVDRIMVDVVEDVEIVVEVVVVVKDNISRVQRDSMKMISLDVATSRMLGK
ncbi:hypothetical protein Tco_0802102 [Tanacetum coccineum]|uniref:Uncharacterized protein n=1 Tax=Tanacetum coccineum TaxID=301880 RepID=A0ABQ4ZXU5_9ASTR